MEEVEGKIRELITDWEEHGHEWKGKGKDRIFAHPEFHFRITGEWTGWNKFLGVDKSTHNKEYHEHLEQDRIEDIAFERIMETTPQIFNKIRAYILKSITVINSLY